MPFQKKLLPALIGILVAVPAKAEEKAANNETTLNKVMVTANKIEEDVNKVPQSITVMDEFTLDDKDIKHVEGVIEEVPNMTSLTNHDQMVNFRGLNTSIFTNNNPVVIYIDGVPTSNRFGFDASMANVERVEVLRGPQGTLYGKDAIGAAINIVTKDSGNEWSGRVGVEAGSFNSQYGTVNASGPLIKDKLYLGINGQAGKDDGWITNDNPKTSNDKFNRQNNNRFSTFLEYRHSEALKAKLTVARDYSEQHGVNGYAQPVSQPFSSFNRDDAEHVNWDVDTVEKNTNSHQALNIDYAAKSFDFASITTHRKNELESVFDSDFGLNVPGFEGLTQFNNNETDTWAQEFRFTSNNTKGMRWVGGFYADTEEHKQGPYGMEMPNQKGIPTRTDSRSKTNSDTVAAFGQLMMPMGQFELTLGLRAQQITKKMELSMYSGPVGGQEINMFDYNDKKTWDTILPKLALSYQINKAWMSYASYSKGYMPGGFNYFPSGADSEENQFDPQTSDNFEVGIKAGYDNLTFAANVFYMDIKDIHVYKSTGPGLYFADNAKRAHSKGAEAQVNYAMTEEWDLSAAVGLIDAKYDDYDLGNKDLDGEVIPNTPKHTINIGVAYTLPEGFYGRLDIRNQGDISFYDDAKQKMQKQSAYTLAHLKAGYRWNDWDFYGYVKNLTDEKYITTYKTNPMLAHASFGQPRKIGAGVRYNF